MRNTKGITLLALVISIVIMMILVGVIVVVALKGNLFENSKKAIINYDGEQIKELLTPIIVNVVIENGIDILKSGNELKFQEELNKQINDANEFAKVSYDWYGNEELVAVLYKNYVCRINRQTGEIIEVFKTDGLEYTGNGIDLDSLNPDEMNSMAKGIEYKIKTLDSQGIMENGYNVVYSNPNPMKTGKHEGSGEQEWMSGDENPIKLVTEIYCANNVMIYDGTSPYVPVMVRFYRNSEGSGAFGNKSRGLKYFIVNEEQMDFSTNNENNDWAFVESSEYNYEATSNRKCTSNINGSSSFNDLKSGDYWASGRLTYTNEPIEILTDLGGFYAMSVDQDGNNEKSVEVGSNYVIDVTEYYSKISEAKSLLTMDNLYNKNKSEAVHDLAKTINEIKEKEYTFSNAQEFASEIQENTNKLNEAIQKLK